MPDTNLDVLRRAYEALGTGEFATLMELLADDVVAHVPGRSQVAGEYRGKEAVGGYVAKLGELSGGTLRFEPHDVTGSEAHGVGLVRDLAERGDRTLAMNNVHVWHMAAGRLSEVWIYPGDLYGWDDFWSLVRGAGNRCRPQHAHLTGPGRSPALLLAGGAPSPARPRCRRRRQASS